MPVAKPNDYLGPKMKELKIDSFEKLREYVSMSTPGCVFDIENSRSLRLDSEDRLYDDDVAFEWKFIETDLSIKNSRTIKLKDCIIDGDLIISDLEHKLTSVFLDYVVIKNKLVMNINDIDNIDLHKVNCEELTIRMGTARDISVYSSTIFDLFIEECDIEKLSCRKNCIKKLTVTNSVVQKCSFDHRQADVGMIKCDSKSKRYLRLRKQHNHFVFGDASDPIDTYSESASYSEKQDTISFFLEKTSIDFDRSSLAKVRLYNSELYSRHSKFAFWLMRFTGGFSYPSYFLMYIVLTLLAFSFVYWGFGTFSTSVEPAAHHISAFDSVYFSGVTLLTIGYGDIAPCGMVRLFAIAEGLLGMFFISAFTVSLYRKYIER